MTTKKAISRKYGTRAVDGCEISIEQGSDRVIYRWWEKRIKKEADLFLDIPIMMLGAFSKLMSENGIKTVRVTTKGRPFIYDRLAREGEKTTIDKRG